MVAAGATPRSILASIVVVATVLSEILTGQPVDAGRYSQHQRQQHDNFDFEQKRSDDVESSRAMLQHMKLARTRGANLTDDEQRFEDDAVSSILEIQPGIIRGVASLRKIAAGDDTEMVSLAECRRYKYTYRVHKRDDETGNYCVGTITTNVCYGGCKSYEMYSALGVSTRRVNMNQSSQNVCLHGQRKHRQKKLRRCFSSGGHKLTASSDGMTQELFDNLRSFYYIEALSCVCTACTTMDTSCLGGSSAPRLSTLYDIITR